MLQIIMGALSACAASIVLVAVGNLTGNITKKKKVALTFNKIAFWLQLLVVLAVLTLGSGVLALPENVITGMLAGSGIFMAGSAIRFLRNTKRAGKQPEQKTEVSPAEPVSEVDRVMADGMKAMGELGKAYSATDDPELKRRINEFLRLTDMIVRDAKEDPSDLPKIRKYVDYYLPTTVKLIQTYVRMDRQGIQGDNIDSSKKKIEDMLDQAIEAYRKHLDSLFENQALDIDTEIDVMNNMLNREGLTGEKDFRTSAGK